MRECVPCGPGIPAETQPTTILESGCLIVANATVLPEVAIGMLWSRGWLGSV